MCHIDSLAVSELPLAGWGRGALFEMVIAMPPSLEIVLRWVAHRDTPGLQPFPDFLPLLLWAITEERQPRHKCAHLQRLEQHVRSFAKIMAHRRGRELPAWLEAVEADDLPALRSLATGMRRDLPAIINGLTLEHSSGAVEGNVTRVKRLKRDGYGRANFDLLRAQILIAA
jgi:hypothetical protein